MHSVLTKPKSLLLLNRCLTKFLFIVCCDPRALPLFQRSNVSMSFGTLRRPRPQPKQFILFIFSFQFPTLFMAILVLGTIVCSLLLPPSPLIEPHVPLACLALARLPMLAVPTGNCPKTARKS